MRRASEDAVLKAILINRHPDGTEHIEEVHHAGRTIPAHLRTALEERDRDCAVPGCDQTHRLEIHHLTPHHAGGPTTLANLARICNRHHDQITYNGAALVGPYPHWTWHPPRTAPPRHHQYCQTQPPRQPETLYETERADESHDETPDQAGLFD